MRRLTAVLLASSIPFAAIAQDAASDATIELKDQEILLKANGEGRVEAVLMIGSIVLVWVDGEPFPQPAWERPACQPRNRAPARGVSTGTVTMGIERPLMSSPATRIMSR